VNSERLEYWSTETVLSRLSEILAIYGATMDQPWETMELRRGFFASHTDRPEFRAVAALGAGDELLGFTLGCRSLPDQWWHQQVAQALTPEEYRRWLLDSYEVIELHVHPESQGHGLGATLVEALVDGLTEATLVLSALEGETRARRFYRRLGFQDLVRNCLFGGDPRPFVILGRDLPLEG
jgi:ribosomal protein S18 acetylase RimI-like enzyme